MSANFQPSAVSGPDGPAAMRLRLAGTNINSTSFLATDYLNHFNEIIMLIDLLPDAVDCIVDCRQWRPRSYTEHFSASSIADSALAIEAYSLAPPQYRVPFDALIADLNRLILTTIDRLDTAIATGAEAELRTLAENASASLRALVGQANAIIHGNAQTLAQSQIDELL